MKFIPLTQGKQAIVDDEDYEWLNQWKWCYHIGYAARGINKIKKENRTETIRMHRVIMSTPNNMFTDHINRNKLDNRKCNLRIVTRQENEINRGKQKNNTSGYKGVRWYVANKQWLARIGHNGKTIHLGYFRLLEDAVRAYNMAALKYHGDFV